jgi:hypothetical protein
MSRISTDSATDPAASRNPVMDESGHEWSRRACATYNRLPRSGSAVCDAGSQGARPTKPTTEGIVGDADPGATTHGMPDQHDCEVTVGGADRPERRPGLAHRGWVVVTIPSGQSMTQGPHRQTVNPSAVGHSLLDAERVSPWGRPAPPHRFSGNLLVVGAPHGAPGPRPRDHWSAPFVGAGTGQVP